MPAPNSAPAASPYKDAVDNYRSTLKWVITTYGSVAGALIVGLQLTSLGGLHGTRLYSAIGAAAVALIALMVVLGMAAYALTPVGGSYAEFQTSKTFAKLREQVPWENQNPPSPFLRGQGEGLRDLIQRLNTAQDEERTNIFTVLGSLTELGILLRVRQLFTRALVAVVLAVPVVAGAVVAYAYLANPPDPTKTVDCTTYYTNLHTLATDSPSLVSALQHGNKTPLPIKIDAQSKACGVTNNAELARLLTLSQ
jgi:hypothetical protein